MFRTVFQEHVSKTISEITKNFRVCLGFLENQLPSLQYSTNRKVMGTFGKLAAARFQKSYCRCRMPTGSWQNNLKIQTF